jgi:FAD/FMN-containing dehydrogenase
VWISFPSPIHYICPVSLVSNSSKSWRLRYDAALKATRAQLKHAPSHTPIRLAKTTSNLFRGRSASAVTGLDVSAFGHVFEVDPVARTAEVGGMTTYEDLVAATLPYGLMPLCVPQLRTITLGGAVTGLGIESASFRNGTPHESVLEMDILTGSGEVLTISGDSQDPHSDLFYTFPNSYGSLGYALRLKIELEPTKPFVHISHVRFDSAQELTTAMKALVDSRIFNDSPIDFLDGVVFSATEQYLTIGTMVGELPAGRSASDYTGMAIYYRSIQTLKDDYLTINDYLWRWDTDWFWCSRAFGAQLPTVRTLWPKSKLRSDVYWKLIAVNRKYQIAEKLDALRRRPPRESVVQDIEIPVDHLPEFLDFFHAEIGIEPIWLCPLKQRDPNVRWPLYEFDPDELYVNVGFWSTVPLVNGEKPEDGKKNRLIEHEVTKMGGRKSLYSTAFYNESEFWSIYGGQDYERVKGKYDPNGRFLGLYEKVVREQ